MKKLYEIIVEGCDAQTVIRKELTVAQFKFLQEIANHITSASSYDCMPTMEVKVILKKHKENIK